MPGGTFYTSISLIYIGSNTIVNFDPNRVAAQIIVSGIGFLGAGAIMRSGGSVNGLTAMHIQIWVIADWSCDWNGIPNSCFRCCT